MINESDGILRMTHILMKGPADYKSMLCDTDYMFAIHVDRWDHDMSCENVYLPSRYKPKCLI